MRKAKIGIYGGTFSPPHIGHINAAKAFTEQLRLDKLLIIPNSIPPHKEIPFEASPLQRLEMCVIAFSEIDIAEISDIEIKRGGKSYTYMTLSELANDKSDIYMLIGTDMFLTLSEWNCVSEIFKLSKICLVRRENDDENSLKIEKCKRLYKENYNAEIYEIRNSVTEISSSALRDKISRGEDVSEYISDGVIQYIEKEGIYK